MGGRAIASHLMFWYPNMGVIFILRSHFEVMQESRGAKLRFSFGGSVVVDEER